MKTSNLIALISLIIVFLTVLVSASIELNDTKNIANKAYDNSLENKAECKELAVNVNTIKEDLSYIKANTEILIKHMEKK